MDAVLDVSFLLTQLMSLGLLVLIQFTSGLLVIHYRVKVNYTRKINHFLLFVVPILFNQGYAVDRSAGLFVLGAVLAVAKFVFYTRPIRERVPFLRIMFRSFDRPEDRPNTLIWIVSQTAVGYLVLIPIGLLLAHYGRIELLLIPLLIYGIGDGLAEPIGVRFGRRRYAVPALFTTDRFHRTYEGSACVFLTSVGVLLVYNRFFTPPQLAIALLCIPILMTLAEALSPHTWDSPLMFLVGGLSVWAVTFV